MKPIEKDELFQNLSQFLKVKGVELQEGSYTRKIQKSCALLADAINLSQQGIEKAKTGIDRKLDQMRQAIHEATAPKPSAKAGSTPPPDPEPPPTPTPTPPPQPAAAVPPHPSPKKPRARQKKGPKAK